jgi:hypothetical protein
VARAIPRALACGDLKYRYILMPMNLTEKLKAIFVKNTICWPNGQLMVFFYGCASVSNKP